MWLSEAGAAKPFREPTLRAATDPHTASSLSTLLCCGQQRWRAFWSGWNTPDQRSQWLLEPESCDGPPVANVKSVLDLMAYAVQRMSIICFALPYESLSSFIELKCHNWCVFWYVWYVYWRCSSMHIHSHAINLCYISPWNSEHMCHLEKSKVSIMLLIYLHNKGHKAEGWNWDARSIRLFTGGPVSWAISDESIYTAYNAKAFPPTLATVNHDALIDTHK